MAAPSGPVGSNILELTEEEKQHLAKVVEMAKEYEHEEVGMLQIYEGQLSKYTNLVKGWQYRWFLLDPSSGTLEYHMSQEQKFRYKPRGAAYLAGAEICPSDEDSFTFNIHFASGDVFKLRACDTRERQNWVNRCRLTVQKHNDALSESVKSIAPNSAEMSGRTLSHFGGSQPNISTIPTPSAPPRQIQRSPSLRLTDKSGPRTLKVDPSPITDTPVVRVREENLNSEDPLESIRDMMSIAARQRAALSRTISNFPPRGDFITSLDRDALLLKATSQATMTCLQECLQCLQESLPNGVSKVNNEQNDNSMGGHSSSSRSDSMASEKSSTSQKDEDLKPLVIDNNDEIADEDLTSESDLGSVDRHKSVILHLLSQLKLGMDLTKVVLPTFILEKRSLLEMYADFACQPDRFLKIADGKTARTRMISVVEWYLTSFHIGRQGSIAKKPYNPIIGEVFHCSWRVPQSLIDQDIQQCCTSHEHVEDKEPGSDHNNATQNNQSHDDQCHDDDTVVDGNAHDRSDILLRFRAEQVSHHPPVSAIYAECVEKKICCTQHVWTKSKFLGNSIGVQMQGDGIIHLLEHDEDYTFTLPSAYARSILTVPWVELGGKVYINCQKTGYTASITFHTKPFYGGTLHKISGEIKDTFNTMSVCKISGEWNGTVELSYPTSDIIKTINTKELSPLRKRVRPILKQREFESRVLWQHVTSALKSGDLSTATDQKKLLEEKQRHEERHRKQNKLKWKPRYFSAKGDGWVYKDILKLDQC